MHASDPCCARKEKFSCNVGRVHVCRFQNWRIDFARAFDTCIDGLARKRVPIKSPGCERLNALELVIGVAIRDSGRRSTRHASRMFLSSLRGFALTQLLNPMDIMRI